VNKARDLLAMSNKDVILPAQSPVWKALKPYRDKVKRNEKGDRYYQWDYTHGDIEEYNSRGEHLGSIDPITNERTKPAVNGRTIKIS
jgi:hypothetical protein